MDGRKILRSGEVGECGSVICRGRALGSGSAVNGARSMSSESVVSNERGSWRSENGFDVVNLFGSASLFGSGIVQFLGGILDVLQT